MAEYIEREFALDVVKRTSGDYAAAFAEIAHAPTVDIAPVVPAEWVYDKNATDWGIGGYVCSACKTKNNNLPCNRVKSALMFSGARYCPNCGAKMDGDRHVE